MAVLLLLIISNDAYQKAIALLERLPQSELAIVIQLLKVLGESYMRSGGDTDTSIAQAHQPNDWQEAERAKIKRLFAIANSLSKLNEIAPITEEDVQTETAAVRAAKTAER